MNLCIKGRLRCIDYRDNGHDCIAVMAVTFGYSSRIITMVNRMKLFGFIYCNTIGINKFIVDSTKNEVLLHYICYSLDSAHVVNVYIFARRVVESIISIESLF